MNQIIPEVIILGTLTRAGALSYEGLPWKAPAQHMLGQQVHLQASGHNILHHRQVRISAVACDQQHPAEPVPYLQERFLLFKVLADHGGHVVCLRIGAQLVGSTTPVFLSLIFLFQALEDTADLGAEDNSRLKWYPPNITCEYLASLGSTGGTSFLRSHWLHPA